MSAEDPLPEAVRQRELCLELIRQLHERGLAEAVDTLQYMVAFYAEEPVEPAPPVVVSMPCTFSRTYTEPVYPVTEE